MSISQMFSNLGSGIAGNASKEATVGGRVFSNKGVNRHPTKPSFTDKASSVLDTAKDVAIGNSALRSAGKEAVDQIRSTTASKNLKGFDKAKAQGRAGLSLAGSYGKSYMTGADYAGGGLNRAGAVAGRSALVAGAVVAPRILSGGDLTTNNRGERDIAGIPFV